MNGWPWIAGGAVLAIAIAAARMRWPVLGRISSRFGEPRASGPHNGVDIAAPVGTPIRAPFSGKVVDTYFNTSGGNSVIMQLDNGYRAGFAHLDRIQVDLGQQLNKGDQLGTVGATGNATGPHLHYTLKKGTEWVDPEAVHA